MTFPDQPGNWQDPTQPTPPTYPPVSPVQPAAGNEPYPTYPVLEPARSGDTQPYPAYAPPPVPGYAGYGYGQPVAVAPTNGMAIAALVCALVVPPIGAILGHVARRQIRQTGEQGDGLALAGIIVGWSLTAIGVLCCGGYAILVAGLFAAAGTAGTGS